MLPLSGHSYVSLEEADAYFDIQLFNTPWTNLETLSGEKERALVTASNYIDNNYSWVGEKNDEISGSYLEWPRVEAINRCTNEEIDSLTIPPAIKEATCIEANYLLSLGSNPAIPNQQVSQGIVEASLDVMKVKYDLDKIENNQSDIPKGVDDILKCYGIMANPDRNWVQGYSIRA